VALRNGLPPRVKAVACRNAKNRFFVPSKANYFGRLQYDFVMLDNGCNSLLLPFKDEVATAFSGTEYAWTIQSSSGTGAVKPPTLIIKRIDGRNLTDMRLAGSDPLLEMKSMRFHIGTASALTIQGHAMLTTGNKRKLDNFLESMGSSVSPERHHVLLGQAYLQNVTSVQHQSIFMMCDIGMEFPTIVDYETLVALVEPMVEEFIGFDDLEDEDHDGDDDEEGSFEFIDEPNE
jgi:hypothetical protein